MEICSEGHISEPEVIETGSEKVRSVLGHTYNFKGEKREVSLTISGNRKTWYIPNYRGYSLITYVPGSVTARTFLNNRCRASAIFRLKDGNLRFYVYSASGKQKKVRSSYHTANDFLSATRNALSGKKNLHKGGMRKHNSIEWLSACLTLSLLELLVEQNPHRTVEMPNITGSLSVMDFNAQLPPQRVQNYLTFPNLDSPGLALKGNRKLRVLREQRLSSISKKVLGIAGNKSNTLMAKLLSRRQVGAGFLKVARDIRALKWENDKVLEVLDTPGIAQFFQDAETSGHLQETLRRLGPNRAIRLLSVDCSDYDSYMYRDACRMFVEISTSFGDFDIPSEIKSVHELHDFLSYIANARKTDNYTVWAHPDMSEKFDNTKLYIYPRENVIEALLFGDEIKEYTIVFPRNDNTLRKWGQDLSICVGTYGHAVNSGRTIVFALMEGDQVYACIDVNGSTFQIQQANTTFNRRIPNIEICSIAAVMGFSYSDHLFYNKDLEETYFKVKNNFNWEPDADYSRPRERICDENETEDMKNTILKEALHHAIRRRRFNEPESSYNRKASNSTQLTVKVSVLRDVANHRLLPSYISPPTYDKKTPPVVPEILDLKDVFQHDAPATIKGTLLDAEFEY